MNTNVTIPQNNKSDVMKWAFAIVLIAIGMIGFYYFSEHHIIARVGGLVVLVTLAAFIALKTALGQQSLDFLHESHIEVRKVVWPTREDTLQTTGVVALVVVLVAIFVWLIDVILMQLMRLVTGA